MIGNVRIFTPWPKAHCRRSATFIWEITANSFVNVVRQIPNPSIRPPLNLLLPVSWNIIWTLFFFQNVIMYFQISPVGGEFERLLAEQAPLEAYTEWVESIVDRCVLQQRGHHRSRPASSLRHSIRQFLLVWMAFSGRLLRELTAQTAAGFG